MSLGPFPVWRIARIMQKQFVQVFSVQASRHLERSGLFSAVGICDVSHFHKRVPLEHWLLLLLCVVALVIGRISFRFVGRGWVVSPRTEDERPAWDLTKWTETRGTWQLMRSDDARPRAQNKQFFEEYVHASHLLGSSTPDTFFICL